MVRHSIYIVILIIVAFLLFNIHERHSERVISFYGYADNKETEINFNHPIQVKKIYIKPGQIVSKDDLLLEVVRLETKNRVDDEGMRINVIRAEKNLRTTKINGDIKLLEDQRDIELNAIKAKKDKIVLEKNFSKELYQDLESVTQHPQSQNRSDQLITVLDQKYTNVLQYYAQQIANKHSELAVGNESFNSEIDRLNYEKIIKEENQKIEISLTAPKDGLIGNVYCEEQEHFSSYKTMLSLYEPNPSMIKGFIQEDFITQVELYDSISIRSSKDDNIKYGGKVIGLGSRIVEIPSRLRKRPDIKTFGREIIVSIPKENEFLQKEKAVLELTKPTQNSDRFLLSHLFITNQN